MCDNNKFFICEHCGNLIGMIHDAGVPMMCCGQKMTKLEPGTVEASHEKHIPVVEVKDNTVTVTISSVEHPMTEEHHIEWIEVISPCGCRVCRKYLKHDAPAEAEFCMELKPGSIVREYCNLHGLWKKDIDIENCPKKQKGSYTSPFYPCGT